MCEEAARRKIRHVDFERMDGERLRLDDASFDVALCALGLMYFPDPVEALREQLRVLRPGGRAVAAVWGARERCGWAEIFPIVDSRVESDVCPLFFQLGTGDALEYAFEAAGFVEITVDRISTVLSYETAEDAVGAAFAGGPVALAHARFDDRTRQEAHADYLASIQTYKNGSGYNIPGRVRGRPRPQAALDRPLGGGGGATTAPNSPRAAAEPGRDCEAGAFCELSQGRWRAWLGRRRASAAVLEDHRKFCCLG